jgi:phosphoenolpyruvate carboxykinase (ATP)
VGYTKDPVFGLDVPAEVPGVPNDVLMPRETWPDKEAYDKKARELFEMFENNYKKFS